MPSNALALRAALLASGAYLLGGKTFAEFVVRQDELLRGKPRGMNPTRFNRDFCLRAAELPLGWEDPAASLYLTRRAYLTMAIFCILPATVTRC